MGIQINGQTDIISAFDGSLSIGGVEVLSINSSGNVGIGTDNPTVFGTAYRTLQLNPAAGTGDGSAIRFMYDGGAANTNDLVIYTNSSQSYIRANGARNLDIMRNGSTVATFNANGIALPSGLGIDFSAASGSAAGSSSAVLDDYEEGTFTPSFLNVAAPTYSNQSGSYVKIGNLVNYTLDINYSSLDTGDASAMAIGGLPFLSATTAAGTVAGGGNVTGGVTINFYSGSATTGVCVNISANVNSLSLLGLGDSNTFDYSNCNATGRIRVTGCYISA